MAFFKRLIDILYRYYDKVLLGILLLLLAVVMYFQGANLSKVKVKVEKMQQDTINQIMRKPDVKPFDAGAMSVDMEMDPERIWKPAPVPSTKAPQMTETSSMSEALIRHYKAVGQGSLFDPIAYVTPVDGDPNLLAYSTRISPFTKLNDEVVEKSKPKLHPDDNSKDHEPGEIKTTHEVEPAQAPVAYLRFRKATQERIPLILKSIRPDVLEDKNTWAIQINIVTERGSQRSVFLRINQDIGTTGYRLVDANYRYESPGPDKPKTELFTAIVQGPDGATSTLERDRQGEGGATSFTIALLPPSGEGKQYQVKSQEVFAVPDANDNLYYYKVLDTDKAVVDDSKQLNVQEVDKTGAPLGSGGKHVVPFISESELQKFLRQSTGAESTGAEGTPVPPPRPVPVPVPVPTPPTKPRTPPPSNTRPGMPPGGMPPGGVTPSGRPMGGPGGGRG